MKILICVLYVLSLLIYLVFGDNTVFWGGFNIITQLVFMCCMLDWLIGGKRRHTECELLFFRYLLWTTIGRTFYTFVCIHSSRTWVLANTDIFTLFTAVSFAFLLLYALRKYTAEFK